MYAHVKVPFGSVEWEQSAPGAWQKSFRDGETVLRLVEFTSEFVEPDWCSGGHVGYVLDGAADIDFCGTTVRFGPGDGIFIPAGEENKHRLQVVGEVFSVVLVERA